MRRLFFDIETSPNIGLFWESGYKLTIPPENIIKERAVICIAWKWAGERRVSSLQWDKKQSDAKMIREFIPVMDEADEVVAHYGDKFDIPWLRARCVKHRIPMVPRYVSHDTKSLAARLFKFNANNLNYLAGFLDIGQKVPTGGFSLWKRVLLDNDPQALALMVKYCKEDVSLLEQVWDRLNPYVAAKSHISGDKIACPECGECKIGACKPRISRAGHKRVLMRCANCGKYRTIPASRFRGMGEFMRLGYAGKKLAEFLESV